MTAGVEPMTAVIPNQLRLRDDVVTDGGMPRRGARQCAERRARLLRRAEGDRMSGSDRSDHRRASATACRDGDVHAPARSPRLHRRGRGGAGAERLHGRDAGGCAGGGRRGGRGAGRGRAQAARRRAAGHQGSVRTRGVQTTAGSRILEGFKPDYESTVTANLSQAGAGMLGKLNMDEFAMGSSNETSAYGPVISPWRRSDGGNAALAPGGSRAARRRRSRRGSRPGVPGPTPAARSASPPPSPASAGSSRPTAAARAGASSPSQARSTRRGRWRRTSATARSCSRRWPGSTRRIRPRSICRCRSGKPDLSSDLKGKRVGIPKEYRIDGVPGRHRRAVGAGHRMAARRGRRDRRDQPAAHQICAADLLHHRPGRGVVQPRPL